MFSFTSILHVKWIFLWLNFFHREERTKEDPKTPEKFQMCSTRSWVGQIKNWRRKLHVWDPPSEGQEDLFSFSSQRYLELTLFLSILWWQKKCVCVTGKLGFYPFCHLTRGDFWSYLVVHIQVLTNSTSWCINFF